MSGYCDIETRRICIGNWLLDDHSWEPALVSWLRNPAACIERVNICVPQMHARLIIAVVEAIRYLLLYWRYNHQRVKNKIERILPIYLKVVQCTTNTALTHYSSWAIEDRDELTCVASCLYTNSKPNFHPSRRIPFQTCIATGQVTRATP